MATAGRRERVVARPPVVLGDAPLRVDQTLAFETIESGVERALSELKHLLGPLFNSLGYAPAVHGLELDRAQHQHVQRALQHVFGFAVLVRIAHGSPHSFRLSEGAYEDSFRTSREVELTRFRGSGVPEFRS